MYTVVLLTAMTAGNTTPDFFFRSGCHGCSGYSCNGCWGGCHGCYSSGCHGCYGSSCHGGLFSRVFGGCHGCYGCSGCYGGCYGCSGCYGGCYGCSGCYGGCYGQVFTGNTPVFNPSGTTGQPAPETIYPPMDKVKEPAKEKLEPINKVEQLPATVTVDVPADGKLYIDGALMKSGSGRRSFQTPALNAGQLYFYDVRVEIVRNGKTIADTQRVILRPGQLVTSSFAHLERQATEPATSQAGQQ